MFEKLGLWRISRLTVADPLGFAVFLSSHDPLLNTEVTFPSGIVVRGDTFVFYGGVETNRTDIPRDANLYVVVISGEKEELIHGFYGREVFVRGKIMAVEEKTKEGRKVEIVGVRVPTSRGRKMVFVRVIGLSPADEYLKDGIVSKLEETISLLTAKNSELEKKNESLSKELDNLKKVYTEIVSKYETCRNAMDRLYFQLVSRLREAEELIESAKTVGELREAAIKLIENLTGEKSLFSRRRKEEEELEKKLKELKKEVEKV
ncbi:MAG: hypothetical protein QXP84_07655 [Candidatus Korarchaeum sp.]